MEAPDICSGHNCGPGRLAAARHQIQALGESCLSLPLGETSKGMAMLSIGEFSKVTGLTVKTVRSYDENGLLPAAAVSGESGYRYYDQACVERARVIRELRALDVSLEDIATILASAQDESDIVSLLEHHAQVIREKLRRYQDIDRSLRTIITREREARMITQVQHFDITEKQLPSMLIAGIRGLGAYSDSGKRFSALGRAVGRFMDGKPLNLFYDTEYKEKDADFESCFPICNTVTHADISVRELEGGRALTLVYQGPYERMGPAYQRVFEHLRAHRLTPRTPSREVYLKGPGLIFQGNPKNYLTEIQFLVEG